MDGDQKFWITFWGLALGFAAVFACIIAVGVNYASIRHQNALLALVKSGTPAPQAACALDGYDGRNCALAGVIKP